MAVNVVYAKPPDGDPDAGIAPPDTPHFGYVVEAGALRIYLSGDPINTFANQRSLTEAVAELRPDVGFFTNHPTEGEFPYFAGSAQMARRCGVRVACPAHYQCFVARNYDPAQWAAAVAAEAVATRIIPRNSHHVFTRRKLRGCVQNNLEVAFPSVSATHRWGTDGIMDKCGSFPARSSTIKHR